MTDDRPQDVPRRDDTSEVGKSDLAVDRRGTSFLVPLGIGAVFVVLAILWVSMSGHEDASSPKDVLTRPNSPSRGG
jgi:hypothetical protein